MWEIFRSVRLRRLFLAEMVVIVLVAVLSVRLRIGLGFEPEDLGGPEWPYWAEALLAGATIPIAVQLPMYYLELYSSAPLGSRTQVLARLLLAHLFAGVVLALGYYLVPSFRVQRLGLAMALLISCWLLFSLRYHSEEIMGSGAWRRRVLILGTGPLGQRIARELMGHPGAGFELTGFLSVDGRALGGSTLLGRPLLGRFKDLVQLVEKHGIDDVVFAPDEARGLDWLMTDLMNLKLRGTAVWSALQFIENILNCLPVELLRPSAVIFDRGFQPTRIGLAIKRTFDVIVSLTAIVLVSPLLIGTAIVIKLDSAGPVFFRQKRVGKRGREFTIIKFRSMRVQAPGEAQRLTQKNDDRITRVGRFIRLHRIDELPQFFNVLIGDMSLVGPRPEVVYSVEELRKVLPFYDQRHAIKPGLTSLGQVRFGAAVTHDEARQRLQYDLYYQKNMSLAFDVSILLDTVKVVLLKIGAR